MAIDRELMLFKLTVAHDNVWSNACRIFPEARKLTPPEVRINARLRKTLARSEAESNWCDYSVHHFFTNEQLFLTEVVPHEIAHNLTDWLYPEHLAHGENWVKVFEALTNGKTAQIAYRTRTGVLQTKRAVRYVYRCACREWFYSGQRHALAKKGREYTCNSKCLGIPVYTGKTR